MVAINRSFLLGRRIYSNTPAGYTLPELLEERTIGVTMRLSAATHLEACCTDQSTQALDLSL